MADITKLKELSKELVRRPVAFVKITWTDTASEGDDQVEVNVTPPVNRADLYRQVKTSRGNQRAWAFCETDNPVDCVARLDVNAVAMPNTENEGFLVGWWGDGTQISDNNRYFSQPYPHINLTFSPIPIEKYELRGFLNTEWAEDFDLVFTYSGGTYTHAVTGNNTAYRAEELPFTLDAVTSIDLYIKRWSHRGCFVKVTGLIIALDEGYGGDTISSIGILEESDGAVGTLPVGHVSANSCDLSLQNIDDSFFFGNTASLLRNSARTNRRVEPFLGFRDHDGTEYLIPKGCYWTSDWTVADQDTTASTSAVDRLGLLQDIQYSGIGGLINDTKVAEESYWNNVTLYWLADKILTDLRDTHMTDLEFEIDNRLKSTTVPLAFLKGQSYFDVIKTIAAAGCAFAYMDTPTDAEKATAASRGNTTCADILRIKPLEAFLFAEVDETDAEEIEKRDIINKTTKTNKSDVVNIVTVPYMQYAIEEGQPKEVEGSENSATVSNRDSILEFGKINFEYKENNLIQNANVASDIAGRIIKAFSQTPHLSELSLFGDVTRKVGDILLVPDYQKHGVSTSGYYAVTRVQSEFDGGLRQNITCRQVKDVDGVIIDEMVGENQFDMIVENVENNGYIDEMVGGNHG
jgi:hypothetical protein